MWRLEVTFTASHLVHAMRSLSLPLHAKAYFLDSDVSWDGAQAQRRDRNRQWVEAVMISCLPNQ
jgi:hypothetical protein